MTPAVDVDPTAIADFARRWQVVELALFGSVLSERFGVESDVDVLVTFAESAPWSLWDLTTMRDELASLFGRGVDLVEKLAIKNPYRRREILSTAEVIYAAG